MNGEQIINELIALLRLHATTYRSASLHQEPYKGDFFKLFAAAYNAGLMKRSPEGIPYLSADALTDILVGRAPDVVVESEKYRILHSFLARMDVRMGTQW